jgi:hypothetical protein
MNFAEINRADGKADRPVIASYDSGYEHSLEHLIYVRHLLDETIEPVEESAVEHDTLALAG